MLLHSSHFVFSDDSTTPWRVIDSQRLPIGDPISLGFRAVRDVYQLADTRCVLLLVRVADVAYAAYSCWLNSVVMSDVCRSFGGEHVLWKNDYWLDRYAVLEETIRVQIPQDKG